MRVADDLVEHTPPRIRYGEPRPHHLHRLQPPVGQHLGHRLHDRAGSEYPLHSVYRAAQDREDAAQDALAGV